MKFRRTKATEAPDIPQRADDTPPTAATVDGNPGVERQGISDVRRPALRRSAADETIDLVRGVRATDRLRHGRSRVIDLDDAQAANSRPKKTAATD